VILNFYHVRYSFLVLRVGFPIEHAVIGVCRYAVSWICGYVARICAV